MTRQDRFEAIWADQHAVPAESLKQYRWITQDGYRLPDMAAHYRTFCNTLDSLVVRFPERHSCAITLQWCREAVEAAGVKVTA
jgi:hypothetical protein